MTAAIELDPSAIALAKALGLVGADGSVDASWFEHPIDHLRTIIDNPVQRRGLLDLLDSALPPTDTAKALAPPGEEWHPIFEYERYGVYLTVAGDVIGVAAAAGTEPSPPSLDLVLQLPLVDASHGLRAIAGTADGPLELSVSVSALGIDATAAVRVDLTGGGSLRLLVYDVDLGDGVPRTVELDPTRLGPEAAIVVVSLVRSVLDELGAGTGRVADHLPGVLGLATGLPLFPFDKIATDPSAFRGWMSALAQDPVALKRWFTHLAGLLGAGSSSADPGVSGEGTEPVPWRAALVTITDGPRVLLTLARNQAGDRLLIGVGVELDGSGPAGAPGVDLAAHATLAAIPLGGTASVAVLPDAEILLVATPPLPSSGVVSIGSVRAGLRWVAAGGIGAVGAGDGGAGALQPGLALQDVVLDGHHYELLDLSSADAIVASAAATLGDAVSDALGADGAGHALAALVGLVAPTTDPGSQLRLKIADLASAPTRAIAAFHLAVLTDPHHSWSALFAELTGMLGLGSAVGGTGSADDPWRVSLAEAGVIGLHLAAWDESVAGDGTGPARHGLRIGLLATAEPPYVDVGLRLGLLGFDLGAGPTATWLLPGLTASASAVPPAVVTDAGLRLDVERAELRAGWRPNSPIDVAFALEQLTVHADGDPIGPFDLTIAASTGVDLSAADLGLGIPPDLLGQLLGLLVAEIATSWGGPTAVVATALVGLHRRLPGLPLDWPLVWPETGQADVAAVLRDPVRAVRDQLHRVATGTSADGTPFALPALRWLRAGLSRGLPQTGAPTEDVLEPLPPGWGTEDQPWRLPLPADPRVDLLLWTGEGGPGPGWVEAAIAHLRSADSTAELLDRVAVAAAPLPAVLGALLGRDPLLLAGDLDALDRWLVDGDGVVPLVSQTAVGDGWSVADPVACAHGDLPADPTTIDAIGTQLDAWQPGADRCVVLVSAPFEDHRVWRPLLASIDPDHAPDAHFQLRVAGADPLQVDLGEVKAVSPTYTVDLADDPDPDVMTGQLQRVVDRARALTGAAQVALVAHSASGLAASGYAAAHADAVAGLVTLAAPLAGGALAPLTGADDAAVGLAEAVRAATALGGVGVAGLPLGDPADTDTPVLRAVGFLAAVLDALPTGTPAAGAAVFPLAAFQAAFPVGAPAAAAVPGLALCSVTGRGADGGAGLVGELADAVARALLAAVPNDGPVPNAADATTLAIGLRIAPTLPPAGAGPEARATIRVPVTELRLADGPALARRRRLQAEVVLGPVDHPATGSTDGWLVGAARPDTDPAERRVRCARLGVQIAGSASGIAVNPIADLYDAWIGPPTSGTGVSGTGRPGVGGSGAGTGSSGAGVAGRPATRPLLTFADAQDRLPAGNAPITFGDRPADGTAGALVVDALDAAGLLAAGDAGFDPDALRSLAAGPAAALGPHAAALADLLLTALGFGGSPAGPWPIDLPSLGARLVVSRDPWTATLAAATDADDPDWRPNARLTGTLAIPSGATVADAELRAGVAALRWAAATGRLTADLGPWLSPIVLWPTPAQPGIPADLPAAIGYLLGSGLASIVGDVLLPEGVRLRSLAGLLRDPIGFLRGLFSGAGAAIDPAVLGSALAALARLLGTDDTDAAGHHQLGLPGGFAVRAEDGPARVLLTGTIDLGGSDQLELGAGVGLASAIAGLPVGEVGLTVSWPGGWGGLTVAIGADPTGLSLVVTPLGGNPIRLLPTVDGLGALAGAAAALLPKVLQTLVEQVGADGPLGDVFGIVLDVAAALGIYGDDADGFLRADRSAELAAMLQPGWLETRTASAIDAVATLIVDLVGAAGLPFGTVDRVGALVRCSVDVGIGTVRVSGGWSTAGGGGAGIPTILIELDGVDLGPAMIEMVSLGYDGTYAPGSGSACGRRSSSRSCSPRSRSGWRSARPTAG